MKNNTKTMADDSSSFSCLPDDIVLVILSKLVDFRTLCLCILVSKRFSRIVLQVDTISFTSFTNPAIDLVASSLRSYWSAISCLKKFERVKSLCIQHPSSFDTDSVFKWKIKFGNSLNSYLFLSANSIYHNKEYYDNANGHEQEEEATELAMKKAGIWEQYAMDVCVRIKLLLIVVHILPLLEKVTIEDSGKRGEVSLGGEKVTEMRNSLSSPAEAREQLEHFLDSFCITSGCYIPLLKLPVSKYVMKGVVLILNQPEYLPDHASNTFFKRDDDDDDSEDKEEAAYSEAVAEIFKNHRGQIQRPALV